MNTFLKFRKRLQNTAEVHSRKLNLLLLLVSLLFLGAGMIRLSQYNVPMMRNDWHQASTSKYQERFEDPDPHHLPFMHQPTVSERFAEWTAMTSLYLVDKSVGSRVEARYNLAIQHYVDNDYTSAASAFQKAFASCCDKDGKVRPELASLASKIQLLAGNCLFMENKIPEAVWAYELALTLDPENITATYNLERLQDSQGGKGGQGDEGEKPQAPNFHKI